MALQRVVEARRQIEIGKGWRKQVDRHRKTMPAGVPDGSVVESVDPDGVQAQFDRGVLEIRIPKPEQKKPKTVQISLGANPDTKTIESANPQANSRDPVAAT